jgi:hypothetical protein
MEKCQLKNVEEKKLYTAQPEAYLNHGTKENEL